MKKLFLLFLAIIASCVIGLAQEAQMLPNDPAVRVGKLDNGMTYYIRHNEQPAQRAEFYLATNVGAIQENESQDGLAHFLEHMCFNGTKNFPGKGILNYLESIGASFGGNVNASTGMEETIYMLNNIPLVNAQVVDTCLLILHDYSHFVNCDADEIEAERGVILEEKRSHNDASWRMREKAFLYLFGDCKYATTTVIGSEENLKTFEPETLLDFYHSWYRPDMQAVVVVGDIDVDDVENKIRDTFADIPAPENPMQKEIIAVPHNDEPIIGIITDPETSGASIEVIWKSEPMPEFINPTTQGLMTGLLKNIVTTVMAERLSEIAARPDAPFIEANFGVSKICEAMEAVFANVVAAPEQIVPAFAAMMTEVERMKRHGFTEAEVERAKTEILSQYEAYAKQADTRKNSEFVMPLIYNFFDSEAYMEPQTAYEYASMLLQQIPTQVINISVKQVITDDNIVIIYEGPEKDGIPVPEASQLGETFAAVKTAEIEANSEEEELGDFVDAARIKGTPVKKTYSGIHGSTIWMLKNGVKVVLLPTEYEKDHISFNLRLSGGNSLIPDEDMPSFEDNIFGLFLQNSGISSFSHTQVGKMLAGKQLAIAPYISSLSQGISGSSTVKDIETAFQMMYLLFTDPRFDENEYAQGIKTIEAVLPTLKDQPNYKLQNELYKTIYNTSRKALINDEILAASSLYAIERNYRMLFKDAAGAVLYIAGDFEPEAIRPLVEKYAGSLPKGKKALQWRNAGEQIVSKNETNDFRYKMQTPKVTVVDVYKTELGYSIQEDVNFEALSYILDMIYVETLREAEGGTYGASVDYMFPRIPEEYAILQIAYETNDESADRLRTIARDGIMQIAADGPDADKFEKTISNLKKKIPERRIRNSYWMDVLMQNELFGEDIDTEYEAAVNSLTPEKIQSAAKAICEGYHMEVIMRPE